MEIRRYQSSYGTWYVQVALLDGGMIELAFDHEPTTEEVAQVEAALNAPPPEPTIGLTAEDGTEI